MPVRTSDGADIDLDHDSSVGAFPVWEQRLGLLLNRPAQALGVKPQGLLLHR